MATKKNRPAGKKTDNVNFSKSIKSIQHTAAVINDKITDATGEILEEVVNNGEQIRKTAVTTFSKVVETVAETVSVENLKATTKNINNYTLKTADELVDVAINSGEKWQEIAGKTMKGGMKLAAKQQDIVFDTLEIVKEQFEGSVKRVKNLMR